MNEQQSEFQYVLVCYTYVTCNFPHKWSQHSPLFLSKLPTLSLYFITRWKGRSIVLSCFLSTQPGWDTRCCCPGWWRLSQPRQTRCEPPVQTHCLDSHFSGWGGLDLGQLPRNWPCWEVVKPSENVLMSSANTCHLFALKHGRLSKCPGGSSEIRENTGLSHHFPPAWNSLVAPHPSLLLLWLELHPE